MHRAPADLKHLLCLIVAAIGCLVPTAWVSFPAAAALMLWLPGQLLVRRLREVNAAAGGAWTAVAASFVLMPVPLSWLWRFSNHRFHVLGTIVAINVVLLLLARKTDPPSSAAALFPNRRMRCWFAAMLLYVGACVFASYWLPSAGGRVGTRAARDYVKHHAVLLSLELHPLPLHNVFYAAEADTPYYYYEYHYYIPATLRKLTDDAVSIGLALAVSSALLAMVFIVLVFQIARGVLGSASGGFFAAACVSLVGGWDIVPVLARMIAGAAPVVVLDSWISIPWRVHNLMTQYMWAPQHIAAVLALMLAALWLRHAPSARWWVLLAPLLAASILGSSVYLAITIFLAAAVYVLLRLHAARDDRIRFRRTLAAVGVIAGLGVALMAVQASGYYEMAQRFPGGLTIKWDRLDLALLGRLLPPGPLANLLDAPWILLLDLGLPAVACLLIARRCWALIWRDQAALLLLLAGLIGTLALFTVRSNINPFDYSFRVAIKPAQIVAALCAGGLLVGEHIRAPARRLRKAVLVIGVLLGLPVGFCEAPLMAVRTFLLPQPYRHDASAIRFLRHQVPRDAVVQGDPTTRVNLPQLVNRQMGVLDPKNSHVRVFFPKDEERMRRVFAMVEQAFSTYSSRQAYDNLRCARVTHVLAGSVERQRFGDLSQFDDPAWFERIYRDQHACVYRLRKVSEALATPKPGQRCRDTLREYEITHVFAGCIEIKRWKGIEERYGIRYFRALFESPHASVFTLK